MLLGVFGPRQQLRMQSTSLLSEASRMRMSHFGQTDYRKMTGRTPLFLIEYIGLAASFCRHSNGGSMVKYARRWAGGMAMPLLLSGCATDTIRLDRGVTMVAAGRRATDETRNLLTRVRLENREALITFAAIDRNCDLLGPTLARGKAAERVLCQRGAPSRPNTSRSFPRLTNADFSPSLAIIDGLTAYLDVVDKVVTRDKTDISGDFDEAYGALQNIYDVSRRVGGRESATLLTEDQVSAVGKTLSLLNDIVDQANRVSDLRAIEINPLTPDFGDAVSANRLINDFWLDKLRQNLEVRQVLIDKAIRSPSTTGFERQRRLQSERMDILEKIEREPELRAELDSVLDRLNEAHRAYIQLLYGDGSSLSIAEKRKRARVIRDRVKSGLSNVAAIVLAF